MLFRPLEVFITVLERVHTVYVLSFAWLTVNQYPPNPDSGAMGALRPSAAA